MWAYIFNAFITYSQTYMLRSCYTSKTVKIKSMLSNIQGLAVLKYMMMRSKTIQYALK